MRLNVRNDLLNQLPDLIHTTAAPFDPPTEI